MIDPVTGLGMAEALSGINAALSGQTLDTAYNDRMNNLIDVDGGPQIGYGDWTQDKPSISGDTSGTISTVPSGVPIESWGEYIETASGVTVSSTTGGAVSGSKVGNLVYSLMEEHPGTAQSAVKAVAVVGVPVAAAITAISQAVGVSLEYANLAAETEQELNNALLSAGGVVYDKAKGLVAAWKDEWGRILFPKKALDSIYDVVKEWGDADAPSTAYYPNGIGGITGPFNIGEAIYSPPGGGSQKRYVDGGAYAIFGVPNSGVVGYGASSNPSAKLIVEYSPGGSQQYNLSSQYTYDGKTVYYFPGSGTESYNYWTGAVNDFRAPLAGPTAWIMVYGTITEPEAMPDGASRSEANSYTPSTIPIAGNLATSYNPDTGDLDTEPLVPINITEDPYDSTASTIDPTSPTDDENAGVIIPGIPGYVPDTDDPSAQPREENVPIPLPIPDTNVSNPDVPLVDSSVVDSTLINELVEELANTLDPQAPQSSGIIPFPPMPGIVDPDTGQSSYPSIVPASGAGFIHVYNPTPAEFVSFGNWLWVTYADATIDKILNNPFDGVIGAHELYATPQVDGSDNIRSAFLTSPVVSGLVRQRYTEIDCGTVVVPEFYGNYLDYSPYSQAYIYLPFIGINEVSIDDIVGHAVNIKYRVDAYSGSCIAMIFVAKGNYQNLCYQFAGNCAVEVPMAGGSQAAIKAAEMQAEAYARASMASAVGHLFGGIGSALMGSLGGTMSNISAIAGDYANAKAGVEAARVANKSNVQHSGQFGASHGAMGEKIPFIIIRNPIQVKVVNYNEDYGFPAHKRVIIGGCRGYLRAREVNVISAHATDDEKAAIEALLKNGVYVS